MSITISEALELETLKNFKVIAGKSGLSNKIERVGFHDYETDELIENFVEGEFIISTLLVIKDRPQELYEIVRRMISVGASGLAIKNIYFNTVPEDVIELANSKFFPLMIFSDVFFEDVLTSVMNAKKEKEEKGVLESKIDAILYSNFDNLMIKKIAYEISRNFEEKNIVVFCKSKLNEITKMPRVHMNMKNGKSFSKVIPYKDGYIIINTFEKIDYVEATKIILERLERMEFTSERYNIGISSLYEKLGKLNYSIKESLYACKYSITYRSDVSFFNKIGTSKVLLPLIDNPWVLKYHDEIIEPLIIYDKNNDMQLLNTAIKYVENNGDIKATSIDMFQHGNTIRYRIDKIYKILNQNNENSCFYEELALAIRIHNLLNRSL